jgi:hypothetical protein
MSVILAAKSVPIGVIFMDVVSGGKFGVYPSSDAILTAKILI